MILFSLHQFETLQHSIFNIQEFQHSQVHYSLVVLHWLLHPFLYLDHHLPHKLLQRNLIKILLVAIEMQVQWTISFLQWTISSPFRSSEPNLLSWFKFSSSITSSIAFAFNIIPLIYIRIFLDPLYTIGHKNWYMQAPPGYLSKTFL